MSVFSAILIGNDTLTLNAAEMLASRGHQIATILTRHSPLSDWAAERAIPCHTPDSLPEGVTADWLLSVANLEIIPTETLSRGSKGAVNFHDAPLPRYAGLNAPVWALINGETEHGITWHRILGGVDEGNILLQRRFAIAEDDTALSLNRKCFAAAMESLPELIEMLASGDAEGMPQDLSQRSYVSRDDRPAAAARLDFTRPRAEALRLMRGLDHGEYWNPLAVAKLEIAGEVFIAKHGAEAEGQGAPGEIISQTEDQLVVACADGAIALSGLARLSYGAAIGAIPPGQVLPSLSSGEALALSAELAPAAKSEPYWRARLDAFAPQNPGFLRGEAGDPVRRHVSLPKGTSPEKSRAAFAFLAERMAPGGVALKLPNPSPGYLCDFVPLTTGALPLIDTESALSVEIETARAKGPFAADLPLRQGRQLSAPAFALSLDEEPLTGAALTLIVDGASLIADPGLISPADIDLIQARLEHLLSAPAETSDLPLSAHDAVLLAGWNATETQFDPDLSMHAAFEAQVAETPDATALIFEAERFSYAELNARANRIAHRLIAMGARRGDIIGLHLKRSPDMLAAALGILKAGGAYLPLDPDYPADRIALYLEDSAAKWLVSSPDLTPHLPPHQAQVLETGDPALDTAPEANPDARVKGEDLAYLIYTSGSTGRPKGVMLEHRNASNFFTGMDARIEHGEGGTWLAVTSLSFDISVLELFWTLSRGLTVVISGEESRALVSNAHLNPTGRGMEFSLYYWGNDDGQGRDKYKLLLEGAEFADKHGFCAVWTPERHFHAFGGPYPNPSVTGAAVAAVTRNLSVRAGSCVAPLHHPARIAEEWAVIDNLTNGRAGLAIASGWQPHDFALRPENTPPENKPAMYRAIDQIRALWRGEEVGFPLADGSEHKLLTQPRPVSKELPLWVTTAGNPATWREAGEIGANVLTHLLGQSVEEVGEKIAIYHESLRGAGHDPADHKVTLMLHSYLADNREEAREIAREPMKDYLRSAAGLIKQFAWAFPAFKRPEGVENPMQLDLGTLSEDELDAILEFAFLRYFEDSGLFGTVEDALERVEQLKGIGVDEIACLIDYGIARDKVLNGLKPLAEVLRRANLGEALAEDDFSIAAQIIRHKVSHLQCTPSMARMLVENDEARAALARVKHLMIGGEALPGGLVGELQRATRASIENMYGPTETTIWSSTGAATAAEVTNAIGRPIANTEMHVLDAEMQPLPIGMEGELFIGGAGVARGYWQRPDLTAERFVENPFGEGRLYRTGDLARWRADGALEFLGRADGQVKLRGHRIELGEIEAALEADPGVTQAVVMAREDQPGVQQLVGYALGNAEESRLRAVLADSLPAHMIPARIVSVESFPLTPNKKIDRKALPAPAPRVSQAPQPTEAVGTAAKLAAIWTRILGVEGISAGDNFFDLGGHSLLAVQAHRAIREELDLPGLSITDIFRFPVLSALAAEIERLNGQTDEAPVSAAAETLANTRALSRSQAMSRRRQMRAARVARQ